MSKNAKKQICDLHLSEQTKLFLNMLKGFRAIYNKFLDYSVNSKVWNNGEMEVESEENDFFQNYIEMEKSFFKIIATSIEYNLFYCNNGQI